MTAHASVVSGVGGKLHYTAGAGETNRVVVELASPETAEEHGGPRYIAWVGDSVPITTRTGCRRQGLRKAFCGFSHRPDAVIALGAGDDSLKLTNSVLWSLDTVNKQPSPTILDGPGNDRITVIAPFTRVTTPQSAPEFASAGPTTLISGSGDDTYRGGATVDVVTPGLGNDVWYGNSGNDRLSGGPGNDWLYGRAGNDVLTGGPGFDRMFGGPGLDMIDGSPGEARTG